VNNNKFKPAATTAAGKQTKTVREFEISDAMLIHMQQKTDSQK
jgi:hypothetical protein